METITLQGIELHAYHGVNPEERERGQTFWVDVELEADLRAACKSDALEDTINYAQVLKCVRRAFCGGEPARLIEHAGERVASALLHEFAQAAAITVRVHKPNAPVKTALQDIVLQLRRKRGEKQNE